MGHPPRSQSVHFERMLHQVSGTSYKIKDRTRRTLRLTLSLYTVWSFEHFLNDRWSNLTGKYRFCP